jgi:hypothetical protein
MDNAVNKPDRVERAGIRKEIKMIGFLICIGFVGVNLVLINWTVIPFSGGIFQIIGALICSLIAGFCLGLDI